MLIALTDLSPSAVAWRLVVAPKHEIPSPLNTQPLNAMGTGRGSLVFYNQASFFHYPMTGERYLADWEYSFSFLDAAKDCFPKATPS